VHPRIFPLFQDLTEEPFRFARGIGGISLPDQTPDAFRPFSIRSVLQKQGKGPPVEPAGLRGIGPVPCQITQPHEAVGLSPR
jgi:hypothetical protein